MASIKSTLRIRDQMSAPLKKITNNLNKTNQGFEKMQKTASKPANVSVFDRIKQKINGIKSATTNASSGFDGLKSKITALVGTVASLGAVLKTLTLADTISNTKARLDMINDGSQSTAELQQKIAASAERSRGAYQDTADAVSKFGLLAGDAFKSNDEIIKFTELLNKQFTISGTSAEGQSSAMLQLTQALGSGVLRGEELNSIFEQAPTIIQDIAKYMGVSVGQIRNMAAEGQITADVVKNALFASADATNAKFEKMPMTFAQIWQSIKNNALTAFQPILQKLTELGNSEKFQTMIQGLINVIALLANKAVTAFNWIADNWAVFESTALPIIQTIWNALTTAFSDIWRVLQPFINGLIKMAEIIFPALWDAVNTVLPPIWDLFVNTCDAIVTLLEEFDLFEIGANIIKGLIDGISSMVSGVVDAVSSVASTIWDGITGFFDINSPSKLMDWAGQMTFGGFDNGLEKKIKDIEGTSVQMGDAVMDNYEPQGGFKPMQQATTATNTVKVVQPNIHVEMNNNNNISSDMDIDEVVDKLADRIEEEMQISAEGVHAY